MNTVSSAAAPPSPPTTTTRLNTRSFSLTSPNQRKHIKFREKITLFQLRYSLNSNCRPQSQHKRSSTFTQFILISVFSLTFLILRLISVILLPDFPHRWRQLIAFASQAEAELIETPEYLFQAVVAYEDRRFFSHFGVDAIGVARAVLSLSACGGGSTITQQLVKNTFLKNERTLFGNLSRWCLQLHWRGKSQNRKSCVLTCVYWGHGIYGIKSASNLYFGKHPSLLSLGECALLVSIIPSPEIRSPFRDYSRGKTFQARVLKRMVVGHFLDIESALSAVRKPLALKGDGSDYAEKTLLPAPPSMGFGSQVKLERGTFSTMKNTWEWEGESKMWEVVEDMEKWATSLERPTKIVKISNL